MNLTLHCATVQDGKMPASLRKKFQIHTKGTANSLMNTMSSNDRIQKKKKDMYSNYLMARPVTTKNF